MEQKSKAKTLLKLFCSFFRIGAFTFGGGYAMIPLMQRETVDKNNWVSEDDILDIVVIAESTPGPVAINAATFIGYRTAGVWGSVMATMGVVLPSFLIIFIISYILEAFKSIRAVEYAFNGIRAGVLALLIKTLWGVYKKCPKGIVAYVLFALSFALVALFKVNVFVVIVLSAIIGLVSSLLVKRREQK